MSAAVRALLFKEMREGRWKYLVAAVVLIALGASIPLTYDYVRDMMEQLMGDYVLPPFVQELMPPELLEMPTALWSDMSTYLWANWHTKNLYQTMVILALVFGSVTVAGEFSRGTAQFLFSRAVPRKSVVRVKAAVDLAGMAAAALLGTVALDVGARAVHGFAVPGAFYAALAPAVAGAAFVYGLALVWSTKIDDPVKAAVAAAVTAALLSVPSFVPSWRSWSVYVHMTGQTFLEDGTFPWTAVLIMAVLAAGLVVAAGESLKRRDI